MLIIFNCNPNVAPSPGMVAGTVVYSTYFVLLLHYCTREMVLKCTPTQNYYLLKLQACHSDTSRLEAVLIFNLPKLNRLMHAAGPACQWCRSHSAPTVCQVHLQSTRHRKTLHQIPCCFSYKVLSCVPPRFSTTPHRPEGQDS